MSGFSQSVCPITLKGVMELDHPVVGRDGHIYEKVAIVRWLEQKGKSPVTMQNMLEGDLTTVWALMPEVSALVSHPPRSRTLFLLDIGVGKDRTLDALSTTLACLGQLMNEDDLVSIVVMGSPLVHVLTPTKMDASGSDKLRKILKDGLPPSSRGNLTQAAVACMRLLDASDDGANAVVVVTDTRPRVSSHTHRFEHVREYLSDRQTDSPAPVLMCLGVGTCIDSYALRSFTRTTSPGGGMFAYAHDCSEIKEQVERICRVLLLPECERTRKDKNAREIVLLLEEILTLCRKTADAWWYGAGCDIMEVFPGNLVLRDAQRAVKTLRPLLANRETYRRLVKAVEGTSLNEWGMHYIRSVTDTRRFRLKSD